MLDLKQQKSLLRKEAKDFRKNLGANVKLEKDAKIFNNILSLNEYKASEVVLCYVSDEFEIDTTKLILHSLNAGKRVATPICVDKDGKMEFKFINSFDELEDGMYGIKEPPKDNETFTYSDNAICIIPSLCVDKKNYRLGYGKGYYDRFLKEFIGFKCVLCYKENIVEKLPCYIDFDIQSDVCITD